MDAHSKPEVLEIFKVNKKNVLARFLYVCQILFSANVIIIIIILLLLLKNKNMNIKYIPYVHSSCVRERIVIKWLSKNY